VKACLRSEVEPDAPGGLLVGFFSSVLFVLAADRQSGRVGAVASFPFLLFSSALNEGWLSVTVFLHTMTKARGIQHTLAWKPGGGGYTCYSNRAVALCCHFSLSCPPSCLDPAQSIFYLRLRCFYSSLIGIGRRRVWVLSVVVFWKAVGLIEDPVIWGL
jgi:hypothetical protein